MTEASNLASTYANNTNTLEDLKDKLRPDLRGARESGFRYQEGLNPRRQPFDQNPSPSEPQQRVDHHGMKKPMRSRQQACQSTFPGNQMAKSQQVHVELGQPQISSMAQPETIPISHEQLVAEVKAIYTGLVMVEAKCLEVDRAQSRLHTEKTLMNSEQWQALITLHRTLLHEHHDPFLAIQHLESSDAFRRLAKRYLMPAPMWRHELRSFLERLWHKVSSNQMSTFLCATYAMMALLYKPDHTVSDTWIKCLEDLARYRMAMEGYDIRDRETRTSTSRSWYSLSSDKSPTTSRLYHHLAILGRPQSMQYTDKCLEELCARSVFSSAQKRLWTFFNLPVSPRPSQLILLNAEPTHAFPWQLVAIIFNHLHRSSRFGSRINSQPFPEPMDNDAPRPLPEAFATRELEPNERQILFQSSVEGNLPRSSPGDLAMQGPALTEEGPLCSGSVENAPSSPLAKNPVLREVFDEWLEGSFLEEPELEDSKLLKGVGRRSIWDSCWTDLHSWWSHLRILSEHRYRSGIEALSGITNYLASTLTPIGICVALAQPAFAAEDNERSKQSPYEDIPSWVFPLVFTAFALYVHWASWYWGEPHKWYTLAMGVSNLSFPWLAEHERVSPVLTSCVFVTAVYFGCAFALVDYADMRPPPAFYMIVTFSGLAICATINSLCQSASIAGLSSASGGNPFSIYLLFSMTASMVIGGRLFAAYRTWLDGQTTRWRAPQPYCQSTNMLANQGVVSSPQVV